MSDAPGYGEVWNCGNCGLAILGGGSWSIHPSAVCQCCVHDRRPSKPQRDALEESQLASILKLPTDELKKLREALEQIRDMKPSELAPETFPGLVHGPALLLSNCQRIARNALRKSKP